MMDFQWRIACLEALSPSLIFGLAGVATISAISGLHMLCSRTLKMLHEKDVKLKIKLNSVMQQPMRTKAYCVHLSLRDLG
ncbi:hypothetical protein TNCV_1970401 [Trichonephila clavipes]|uniref:Uncharacterized protein n=1 Tax=Trichonephila clavipes TaxID=2585209 RepID=A0A8X6W4Y5_TRICX|nr:hypothetical protein TNCV_1970401 [Trichonephila clavipes]